MKRIKGGRWTVVGCLVAAGMALPLSLAGRAVAADVPPEYYVAPDGKTDATGAKDAPWDIASALSGKHKVEPGATVWIAAGTYKCPDRTPPSKGYAVKLAGAEGKPIVVRPAPGARATIDGGLNIAGGTAWLWIRDLEIMVSEKERTTKIGGSGAPSDLLRPWGGLEILGGKNCKYINLVIHDNNQGCGFWTPAIDSEIYGCLIYDNGWVGPDRGHGHCIYSQNKDGTKTIADNIFCVKYPGTYSFHAYGSKNADVDNYIIAGNIAFGGGPFLVGSGKPSHNIHVLNNYLYGVGMQIGYNAPENEDCEVRDNTIVNGSLSINKYKKAVNENNLLLAGNAARPKGALVALRPNKYDDKRANLVIYNWDKAATVSADAAGFLKDGEKFKLMDPKDFFGKPVAEGVSQAGKITVPMTKGEAVSEFAVFVVLK